MPHGIKPNGVLISFDDYENMKKHTEQLSPEVIKNLKKIRLQGDLPSREDSKADFSNENIPKKLKKFEIIDVLGIGGMGKVYRGRHPDLGIQVAIKTVLESNVQSSQYIERFKREARLATQLNNPNIVRVYDVDKEGELYFIVHEFVDGPNLHQLLRSTPGNKLTVDNALNIVYQIAKALVDTAKHKIVHRDIKPQNILITKEGIPKLADLGIAKQEMLEASQSTSYALTQQGLAMGTLGYMAPEQILDSKNVDVRADIFSLGVTFFYILTGELPFSGDNYCKIVGDCLHGDTPDPRDLDPSIPVAITAIIAKMMSKDRRDRYQTPEELLRALEDIKLGSRETYELGSAAILVDKPQALQIAHIPKTSTSRTMNCPKCGSKIPFGFKFCGECGHQTEVSCPKCSATIPSQFKFCGRCGYQIDPTPPLVPEQPSAVYMAQANTPVPTSKGVIQTSQPTQREERRQVAILIAEVSGLTLMSEKLDPEEVQETMNQVFEGMSQAIHKEGGYVDKYGRDNIMALFGAPVAHEDDVRRACRAALGIQKYFDGFEGKCRPRTEFRLHIRIAINFGLVFVGRIGSETRKDYSALGKTVNLAISIESNAPPGGILVAENAVKMVNKDFEFGPIRRLTINTVEEPVEARLLLYEINKLSPWPIDKYSTPYVGREDEVRHLVNLMQNSKTHKRWIEICGEQGVGKTRIVREAALELEDVKILPVVVTSSFDYQLFGLIQLLVRTIIYDIVGHRRHPATRSEFAEVLNQLGDDLSVYTDALWYLSAPRSLAVAPSDPDPAILRRIINQGITSLLKCFERRNQNALIFIDGHDMADEASIELIERQGLHSEGWPISIIVTRRSNREAPLQDQVAIQLSPLSNKSANELFQHLVHGAVIPDKLREDILNRSVGIPFQIEEMVQDLVDNQILIPNGDDENWSFSSKVSKVTLPPSIFSSMVSRLDRLEEPERDLLRQCSVQGVEFDEDVAEAVRQDPSWQGPQIKNLLPELKRRGLIWKDFSADRGVMRWKFRQPLMRDACYQTLLIRSRRELHARIADIIQEIAGGSMAKVAETVAHHYELAQRWDLAAEANLIVGNRASEMFLNEKALTYFGRTIEMVDKLVSAKESDIHAKICAFGATIRTLLRIGNYTEAEKVVMEMEAVANRAVDKAEVHNLYGLLYLQRGLTTQAEIALEKALEYIQNYDDETAARLDIVYNLANIHFLQGNMDMAKNFVVQYRTLVRQEGEMTSIRIDILDGNISHNQGQFTEAVELYSKARNIAEQVGSMSDLANALNNLGNTLRDSGDYGNARENFKQALEIWSKIGLTACIAGVHLNLGNLSLSQGNFEDAHKEHQLALQAFQKIGNIPGIALTRINLAIAAIEKGEGKKAVRMAKDALKPLKDAHYALLRGQSLVILGEGYLACTNPDNAEKVFKEIIMDYDRETHLLAIAGALRGLGRVATLRKEFYDAIKKFDNAIQYFEKLNREQETCRTEMYRAEALLRLGKSKEARSQLENIKTRFNAIGAHRDESHATSLLQEIAKS